MNVKINCHSSICIDDTIYVDPFNIKEKVNNASIVFVTHSHFDHLDVESIKNVINDDSIIVTIKECKDILINEGINKIVEVYPGYEGCIGDIKFEVFHSYNVGHHHFFELGFVGFVIKINNIRYMICGDSDNTEELRNVKCDVLLVPIGGTYTMNAKEAADLTNYIRPSLVIPTHYNFIDGTGTKEDEKKFLSYLDKDIMYKILIK